VNYNTDEEIDRIELKKALMNRKIFAMFNDDHFEINTALKLLNTETLPISIPLNNNMIFIRDLTNYIVENGITLKPNIGKYQ
jgi:hypothetical protein